jgi:threonine aldolase
LARHAIEKAMEMKQMFKEAGYKFYLDSPTNQQFVIIPNAKVQQLEKNIQFTHWGPYDDRNMICRFVTSWATTDDDLKTLKDCL